MIEMKRASRNNKKMAPDSLSGAIFICLSLPLYRTNRCPSSTTVTPNSRLSAVYSIARPVFPLCSRPAVSTEKAEKVVKPPHTPHPKEQKQLRVQLGILPRQRPD